MFSNDHNVDIVARLISNLKKYGELRLKSFQLDLVSKLTLILTFLVVAVLLIGVASIVVLLLSFALVYALAPIVGGIVVSCGIVAGAAVLDLDYAEDSTAHTDANFVLTGSGGIIEVQGTAEREPFSEAELMELLRLARHGCTDLLRLQREAFA